MGYDEVRAASERAVTLEEARAWAAPVSAEERERVLELVEWFTRRYPTPAARLAYVRAAYRRWKRVHEPRG
jgi:hypothetical protein